MRHPFRPGGKNNHLLATLLPLAMLLLGLLACWPAAPPEQPGQFPNIETAQPSALTESAPPDPPVAQPAVARPPTQPEPAEPAPQEEEEEEDPTPTPTPDIDGCGIMPEPYQSQEGLGEGQVMKDGIKYQCFPDLDPTPTPKYPALGSDYLSQAAVEGEEALKEKEQASGASADAIEIPKVTVGANFKDAASAAAATAWLAENGVPYSDVFKEGDVGAIFGGSDKRLWLTLPAFMLPDLQKRKGFHSFIYPIPSDMAIHDGETVVSGN